MSDAAAKPTWNTAPIWGILLVFLLVGTIGGATFVYGLFGVLAGQPIYAVALVLGAAVAFLSFLFLAGILYRVDRYRGVAVRRMKIFE